MKLKISLVLVITWFTIGFSQRHEIGIFGGFPNIIGDVGKTNFISFPKINTKSIAASVGINYRFNMNPRQSLRFNFLYSTVHFDDARALEDYRTERNLSGRNNILEANLNYEYYFWDINDEHKTKTSPYIYAGISGFQYRTRNYKYSYNAGKDRNGDYIDTDESTLAPDYLIVSNYTFEEKPKTSLSANFGVGLKVKFNYNWIFFAEIGFRPTLVDDLDYSYAKDLNNVKQDFVEDVLQDPTQFERVKAEHDKNVNFRRTGNVVTNDWFVVTGVGLAYAFGRPPCYCD